jgi:hypothetical protein
MNTDMKAVETISKIPETTNQLESFFPGNLRSTKNPNQPNPHAFLTTRGATTLSLTEEIDAVTASLKNYTTWDLNQRFSPNPVYRAFTITIIAISTVQAFR